MSAEKAQTDDERVESVVASSDIQTLLVLVDTLIKRTKRARAFALLRAVLRRFPSCATAYDRLINILLGKQRYEAARNLALLALGQGVHNWNIYLGLYEAYHGLGNGQAAVNLIHQGIVEFGPDHTVLKRSADILMTKKYFEEAHRIFEVIVFHYPDDCDALYNNAYAHHMLGRYQEALALNLKCLALEPRQTVYAFFHVNLLTSLRRFHEAIAQLRLLLAEYPSNATYRRTLSDILAHPGAGQTR
jgi:tetratricopeptide (TPR) repeat protein